MKTMGWPAGFAVLALAGATLLAREQQGKKLGYDDTPLVPGSKWHVHDGSRPQPRVVTPGDAPGKPPSDAVALFDGTDLSKWRNGKGEPAAWKVENGYLEVVARTGDIFTRDEFGDCQLHFEFATPAEVKGSGQGRGNSGLFFFGRYELQVLDSFENPTYPDGQAAALYGQCPPLVNAARKPGEWQAYDVVFTAPRFEDGKVKVNASITVFHNGVVVHNRKEIIGDTNHRTAPAYKPHGPRGPIKLQDHGNPMRFRNIWIRELKGYDEP